MGRRAVKALINHIEWSDPLPFRRPDYESPRNPQQRSADWDHEHQRNSRPPNDDELVKRQPNEEPPQESDQAQQADEKS